MDGAGDRLRPRSAPERRFPARLARLVLSSFFRRVEVVGRANLSAEHRAGRRPLLLVGNHINALIDPVLLVGTLPVESHFLAKSTLWDIPPLRPLLRLGRAIPVFRRQDEGVDTSQNQSTFERCHEILAAGGAIALFPEGQSHNQASLAPLRTGAARILLEAEERFGPLGTEVVPVGLTFDDKGRFRSRALVWVGEAIDPAPEVEEYLAAPQGESEEGGEERRREAVRRLTERIAEALETVTLNYDSWNEAELIAHAVDLFERSGGKLPQRRTLAAGFPLHRAFIGAYDELSKSEPERLDNVKRAIADYDRALAASGLSDRQVAARYPLPSVLSFLGRTLLVLGVLLPFGGLGAALNWVPYRLSGAIAARIALKEDEIATWKLFPSLLMFPAVWLLEAAAVGWASVRYGSAEGFWQGAGWGALFFLLAPFFGWLALRLFDRMRVLLREARAYLTLRYRRHRAVELARLRERARDEVLALAGRYRER